MRNNPAPPALPPKQAHNDLRPNRPGITNFGIRPSGRDAAPLEPVVVEYPQARTGPRGGPWATAESEGQWQRQGRAPGLLRVGRWRACQRCLGLESCSVYLLLSAAVLGWRRVCRSPTGGANARQSAGSWMHVRLASGRALVARTSLLKPMMACCVVLCRRAAWSSPWGTPAAPRWPSCSSW